MATDTEIEFSEEMPPLGETKSLGPDGNYHEIAGWYVPAEKPTSKSARDPHLGKIKTVDGHVWVDYKANPSSIPEHYIKIAMGRASGKHMDEVRDEVDDDLWLSYTTQRHRTYKDWRGTGKSSAVKAIARRAGVELALVYLSTVPPEEVGGIPHASPDGYFDRLKPGWMRRLHPGAIICFEEFNQASPETLNAIFSLCDSTPTFHGEPLPPVWVCALGNREEENETLSNIPLPLRERMPKFTKENDFAADAERLGLSEADYKKLHALHVSKRLIEHKQKAIIDYRKAGFSEAHIKRAITNEISWEVQSDKPNVPVDDKVAEQIFDIIDSGVGNVMLRESESATANDTRDKETPNPAKKKITPKATKTTETSAEDILKDF